MFGKNESAQSKAGKILAELPRIDQAEAATRSEITAAEAQLVSAEAFYAEMEVAAVLGDSDSDVLSARAALDAALSKLAGLRSRLNALQARRTVRESEMLALSEQIQLEEAQARETRLKPWLAELHKRAAALRFVLLQGLILSEEANYADFVYLRDASLPSPDDVTKNLLSLSNVSILRPDHVEFKSAWSEDSAAVKFHSEISREFAVFRAARQALKDLQRRQDAGAKEAAQKAAARGVHA